MDNDTKLFTATCLKFYPFGLQTQNSWTRDSTVGNNFLYDAGNELNTTTGVYETMFRGYDPALGRFMQVDPLALYSHTLTPYHYAANNPANFNDPTGLQVPLSSLSQSQQNALYRSSGLFYDNYNEWAMDYQAGPDGGGGGVPDGVYRDSKGRDFYVQGGEAFVRSLRTMDGSGGELVSAKGVLLLEEGENSNSSYQRGSFLQQAADAYLTFRSLQQLAQSSASGATPLLVFFTNKPSYLGR
ncbi:MAG: hypothetical protein JST48_01625 [Bacteroidetes bacterium]|nr:hypothetical protein [Bacteroidota bacterium]